jgi:hypothetical protein
MRPCTLAGGYQLLEECTVPIFRLQVRQDGKVVVYEKWVEGGEMEPVNTG